MTSGAAEVGAFQCCGAVLYIFDEVDTADCAGVLAEGGGAVLATEHDVGVLWEGDVAQVDGDGFHVDIVYSPGELEAVYAYEVVGVKVNVVGVGVLSSIAYGEGTGVAVGKADVKLV